MANIITCMRIMMSAILLFCPALSPVFLTLYIACGLSDILDGAIARITDTTSELGSKLDTIADFIFATVCLIKLIPFMHIPIWLVLWTVVIAIVKLVNIAVGFIRQKKLMAVHSVMNKVTGGMLFLFPLTLSFIELRYSGIVVCLAATIAAIHEGYCIERESRAVDHE